MFFSDGKYVACFNAELKEGYGDGDEHLQWNPCFKNRKLTDDQRHSQLVFFTTKNVPCTRRPGPDDSSESQREGGSQTLNTAEGLLIKLPTPPDRATPPSEESSRSDTQEDVEDHDFSSCADEERKPYYPNQKDLNDLIRDLGLTKSNAELLTSRLKQWNLLDESVQVTGQRKRHQVFSTFFSHQDGLCFCNNVAGLFEAIGITCNPNEWRLFIDSSCKSLKAVLLHNGNKYPSLPVAHLKEEYTSVKMLLGALKYDEYGWEVIGDFKMVSFLMGLQGGFTKYPCFICLWDSRDTKAHYHRRDWPQRTEFTVGKNNVKWDKIDVKQKNIVTEVNKLSQCS
ncbi:hypothetical protein MHYP_G00219240 [Metynnis hypsauchen]